jgi:hypothetical protein
MNLSNFRIYCPNFLHNGLIKLEKMSERRKCRFRRLIWMALSATTAAARPYIGDVHQGGVQQSMDSMSPVERFLFNQHVVHTFDTVDSCSRKCPRQCVVQEVADLMMPRYVCPAKVKIVLGF